MIWLLFIAAVIAMAAATGVAVRRRERRDAARRRATEAVFQASVDEFDAEIDTFDNPAGFARLRHALDIARREEDDR